MSKRFFAQQHGERKKAKLDITISDHNFPLSQNAAADDDNWGDENEDAMLLMASQACEQAYGNNSSLPDFSLCMQPGATSTQMFPQPGPSKEFQFKKPTINSPHLTSTHLKDKCSRMSSPLPGISSKVISNGETLKYNDDLIYNDKVCKGQDPDHVYRQLLQLQEENAKLKSENGKLLDKCVTKEGEASILRTQLKSCQVAVDNARIEKVKAQEKVQMEWTEKLSAVTGQMHDLRTQLDFKNLEIISIKERCRMLESSKVKLTQVTVTNNDISSSHRQNNLGYTQNSSLTQRRMKVSSTGAQTDSKAHFLKLYKSHNIATPNLTSILPAILEPTTEQPSLLDCNEKLQSDLDQSQHPCRVFSTFHRVPTTPVVKQREVKLTIACIHEDLTCIADGVDVVEKFDKIVGATCLVLQQQRRLLTAVRARGTSALQRDMDLRYVAAANTYLRVPELSLLAGGPLYKDEQGILARRMVAALACVLRSSRGAEKTRSLLTDSAADGVLQAISDVCSLLDTTSCATLYNGLLHSITLLLEVLPTSAKVVAIVKSMIACRAAPAVAGRLLGVLRRLAAAGGLVVCGGTGNMRVDFEQGVLLYKKDSCLLHVFLKQVEVALKCIEKQELAPEALAAAQHLLGFHANYSDRGADHRCDCQLVLMQVLVYALRICSAMLNKSATKDGSESSGALLALCRSGAAALQRGAARDVQLCARLGPVEGAAQDFLDNMRNYKHPDLYENMLAELAGALQGAEDAPAPYLARAWPQSFAAFSRTD